MEELKILSAVATAQRGGHLVSGMNDNATTAPSALASRLSAVQASRRVGSFTQWPDRVLLNKCKEHFT